MMRLVLFGFRWAMLTTTAIFGGAGAYVALPELVDDLGYGSAAISAALYLVPLAASLVAGALFLLRGEKRLFRIHAAAALLLFGIAFLTVLSTGYYFLTSGALAVLSVCMLATRRPDGEPYAWLDAVVRTRQRA
jgi:hypothetical protein